MTEVIAETIALGAIACCLLYVAMNILNLIEKNLQVRREAKQQVKLRYYTATERWNIKNNRTGVFVPSRNQEW